MDKRKKFRTEKYNLSMLKNGDSKVKKGKKR